MDAFAQLLPDLSFALVSTGGSVTQLEAVQNGSADVGTAMSDVTYLAFRGRLEHVGVFDKLRGISVLRPAVLHVLVRAGSNLHSIADFRGSHVALGARGSETALAAQMVLHAFDLTAADVHGEFLAFPEAADRLARGNIDAAFLSNSYPAPSIAAGTRTGAGSSMSPVHRLTVCEEYPFLDDTDSEAL